MRLYDRLFPWLEGWCVHAICEPTIMRVCERLTCVIVCMFWNRWDFCVCVCVYVWEHISCSSNLGAWDYVGMCIRFYNVFIHFTNNVITFNCIPIMFCIFKILRLLFKVSSYVFREIVCFFFIPTFIWIHVEKIHVILFFTKNLCWCYL